MGLCKNKAPPGVLGDLIDIKFTDVENERVRILESDDDWAREE